MSEVTINDKVNEIIGELKKLDLWKKDIPAWVINYERSGNSFQMDFAGWLQFIFLPNCLLIDRLVVNSLPATYLGLQAKKNFNADSGEGKLLQLLIELDALS